MSRVKNADDVLWPKAIADEQRLIFKTKNFLTSCSKLNTSILYDTIDYEAKIYLTGPPASPMTCKICNLLYNTIH